MRSCLIPLFVAGVLLPSAAMAFVPELLVRGGLELLSAEKSKRNPAVVEIPVVDRERIANAEREFFRRELLQPVIDAYASEDEMRRRLWEDVLRTATDSLYYLSGGILPSHRQHIGSGAETAYRYGCCYPLPIAYAYASVYRQKEEIKFVNARLWKAAENDKRWNAATMISFLGFLGIEKQTPDGLDVNKASREAVKRFFRETRIAPDELGAVYQLVSFSTTYDILPVLEELETEGVAIDPWLMAMFAGDDAHARAWKARGKGFAHTVSDEGWEIYEREIAKVMPQAEKAYTLRPDLPQSTFLALKTCYGEPELQDLWLKRTLACRPDYLNAHAQYLFGNRPRWCGSTRHMAKTCLMLARRHEFETALPIFAFERLEKDVFREEKGWLAQNGERVTIRDYVVKHRDVFEPYFDGYRASGFLQRASFLERAHVMLALADIAWHLGDPVEYRYWYTRFNELKIFPRELKFGFDVQDGSFFLESMQKLSVEEQKVFFALLYDCSVTESEGAVERFESYANAHGIPSQMYSTKNARTSQPKASVPESSTNTVRTISTQPGS